MGMIARCTYPSVKAYRFYGARGIKVCERWRTFENFLADMGERPAGMSIDRVDNAKGYEPGNCRWATDTEQHRNRTDNKFLTFQGKTLTIAGWAELLGIDRHTLADRIRKSGWTVEKALTTPVMSKSEIASITNKRRWG